MFAVFEKQIIILGVLRNLILPSLAITCVADAASSIEVRSCAPIVLIIFLCFEFGSMPVNMILIPPLAPLFLLPCPDVLRAVVGCFTGTRDSCVSALPSLVLFRFAVDFFDPWLESAGCAWRGIASDAASVSNAPDRIKRTSRFWRCCLVPSASSVLDRKIFLRGGMALGDDFFATLSFSSSLDRSLWLTELAFSSATSGPVEDPA
mmetsp:Transcript_24162/g.57312  ORF Transcript_24162/g.57312 Transcript_24162/m.57312 type:complete len:206 (-) Transcript_24162:963-1580(-)